MKIYHGTTSKYIPKILSKGILPRKKTHNSNWNGSVVSKENFVYLTTAYPIYFALNTCMNGDDLAIIEVDVDTADLYPDEDYIAKCLKYNDPRFREIDLRAINPMINLEDYKEYWEASLKYNGLVCIKRVKKKEIIRHVIIPHKEINIIINAGADSIPIPMNYLVCGLYYKECIRILFDGGLDKLKKFIQQKNFDKYIVKSLQENNINGKRKV